MALQPDQQGNGSERSGKEEKEKAAVAMVIAASL